VADWRPAELVAGGIPVLPRYHVERPREELVFRALLGQPLILYGHHGDLSGGLDAFARAAADIAELGEVRWGPLDWIAASNYSTRREGDVLGVRLHSRRARVEVPRDVSAVRLQVDAMVGEALWGCVACDEQRAPLERDRGGWISPPLQVRAGSEVEVSLPAAEPLLPEALANTRPAVWPIARRLLTESRDRARPLLARPRPSALW
jgi:hypothetical protein